MNNSSITREEAQILIDKYGEAWVTQDPDKIIAIFTPDATYHEYVLRDKPFTGHAEIRKYWEEKVCKEEAQIKFKLLHFYIDGDTVIAEWEAELFNTFENVTYLMREVALLEIENHKIKSLREYWHNTKI